jgi:hypothetical protein
MRDARYEMLGKDVKIITTEGTEASCTEESCGWMLEKKMIGGSELEICDFHLG